jgi:hypothetical protein
VTSFGEREIVEFTLTKTRTSRGATTRKVGDVALFCSVADPKKNTFTLMIQADDRMIEKKDRHINEPLQFYVSKALYEIVVNSVGKDQIRGYLSRPKYRANVP